MAENRSQKLRGPKGPGGRRGMGPKGKLEHPGQTIKRLLKYIGKSYGVYMVLVLILIIVSVLANVQGTMFTKSLIDDYITPLLHAKEKNFMSSAILLLSKLLGEGSLLKLLLFLLKFAK